MRADGSVKDLHWQLAVVCRKIAFVIERSFGVRVYSGHGASGAEFWGEVIVTYLSKRMRVAAAASLLVTVGAASPALADDHENKSWWCTTVGVFCGDEAASKSDAASDKADKGSANADDKAAKGSDNADAAKKEEPSTGAAAVDAAKDAAGAVKDAATDAAEATSNAVDAAADAATDAAGAAADAVTPAPATPSP